jgi:alginate O-acetyltransferase complex protein AlgI
VVVADNCAVLAQNIFENHESMDSITLLYGAVLFAFQIYGDFSGYSDIAIGTARLFGFNLMRNFAYPYFSRDIAEFWRRWHISLSTWFRDYLYIPLGGSRGSKLMQFRNVLIIFLVSGFWHGANWTFIVWGAIHAFMFLPLMFLNLNRKNIDVVASNSWLPRPRELFGIGITFFVTCIAWVFFRADSLSHAYGYIAGIFSFSNFELAAPQGLFPLLFIALLLTVEWLQRRKQHALMIENLNQPLRWLAYYGLVYLIFYFKPFEPTDFIYFQF